ncbi:MAG: rRNA pseudouridine synthase, partial [SAR324 cluster bacterium]|nr:rRNA pseudouridine synthase [SAR324 cluster bacterium]
MTQNIQREMRINKAIALAGLASRREADRLILQGEVRVNGEPVREPGLLLRPGEDRLEVSGRLVSWEAAPETEVWALYKPKNVVSTLKDPQERPSIAQLLPRSAGRLFPVGRLD